MTSEQSEASAVVGAVESLVGSLRVAGALAGGSGEALASLAVRLAEALQGAAPYAAAALSRELRAVMKDLATLPQALGASPLEEIQERRRARLAQNRSRWDANGQSDN